MTPLQQAARNIILRWDSPLWKDQAHTSEYVNALRKALEAEQAQAVEPQHTKTEQIAGAISRHISTPLFQREVLAAAQYIVHRYLHPAPQAEMIGNGAHRLTNLTQVREDLKLLDIEQLRCGVMLQLRNIEALTKERDALTLGVDQWRVDYHELRLERDALAAAAKLALEALSLIGDDIKVALLCSIDSPLTQDTTLKAREAIKALKKAGEHVPEADFGNIKPAPKTDWSAA